MVVSKLWVNSSDRDQYCAACGTSFLGNREREVFSFGSWGINVCFGRPGTFVMMKKNDTKIVLTNRRVYGSSIHSSSLRFEVPYRMIIAMEVYNFRFNIGNWKVFWIRYQEPDKSKEVSLMSMLNTQNIDTAYNILQKALSNLPH